MIYRVDVWNRVGSDPLGESVRKQITDFGLQVGPVRTARIFLIDTDAARPDIERIARQLLADSVVENAEVFSTVNNEPGKSRIEIHLKPGVMDPVAASTEMAIRDMGLGVREVRTGRAFVIDGQVEREKLRVIAASVLANGVIETVHFEPFLPTQFEAGRPQPMQIRHVQLLDVTDEQLTKLSREAHLFLSLEEMKTIQSYFRSQNRQPTDIELETIAQTWSEHCVHKTLKSRVEVEVRDGQNNLLETRRYQNLIKDTIFTATKTLMESNPGFCLSVFKDNAGVISFDETDAVCFKVETHNHPSAIEPYGGSATGIGGVIRDILGTGLAAKPVANSDVFCVAFPERSAKLPRGVIHPRRILQQVVAGVRDYGNRMGIPTVNGAVYFDDSYLGNPLVFCGCVGLIPRNKIEKQARNGDAIVVLGGRTGRDGIHGATFSSSQLTDTHSQEFSHAVQIGNAITEKKVADVILEARDRNLFTAITDCGAGGLSSAVGEMGQKIGASVRLEKVPLKYAGLRYDEIWISEAQERMVVSVAADRVDELLKLAASQDVEVTVIGTFGTPNAELILHYSDEEVGRLSMEFLHDGIPQTVRKAIIIVRDPAPETKTYEPPAKLRERLLSALSHPNIASKHWIVRQYDHEVQGGSVIKPLVGPLQLGPSDAAVFRPKLASRRGVVIGCGMVPHIDDPYEMALASIDEAIRNVVAVGADPNRIAILDNFCWPSVDDEQTMGTLVRACEACRDAALAYRIPFISGKDSLHNQFTDSETGQVIRIRRTLLISAIGVIDDITRCVTMDFKKTSEPIYLLAARNPNDLADLAKTHRCLARLISAGHIAAAHDISDGGVAVAAAEMCIASGCGLNLDAEFIAHNDVFAENPGRYLIQIHESAIDGRWQKLLDASTVSTHLGFVQRRPSLMILSQPTNGQGIVMHEEIPISDLTSAWRGTLDW